MTASNDRLVFTGISDLSGIVRGKSFPVEEWDKRLKRGVGWTPTNVQITCFDTISESPFGSLGDLALVSDPDTRTVLEDGPQPLDFALGNIRSLEGDPWAYCTRSLAQRAVKELYDATGATPLAAFEHEFQLKDTPPRPGDSFGFKGFRDAQAWAEAFTQALRTAKCVPDTFMKEYGPAQYEITNKPARGIKAADDAVILRLLANDVLPRFGVTPTFTPIMTPDSVGNGVHIHFSFLDDSGLPLTYDADNPYGMSTLTQHFIGGILHYLDQIIAILAPSEISYLRLTPHRWSAVFNNLGYRDREASVRICPTSAQDEQAIARQFNFEVRAVDAAASPHLAFAALVFAGLQGIKDKIAPSTPTEEDLSLLSAEALQKRGFTRLPQSLGTALDVFAASSATRAWFGDDFVDLYVAHKRGEMEHLKDLDWPAKCAKYMDVY
ncbi:glutamine synthetase family protein [uncultured Maritalea sp.]|uniref:glutamine synthetase family protein n=1 Tax=uncultured Maritalea sp. TaxID=757249 RepID=UPI00262CBF38|nr:glutamine synthetase family protein [uncultured Maritalea sp.]